VRSPDAGAEREPDEPEAAGAALVSPEEEEEAAAPGEAEAAEGSFAQPAPATASPQKGDAPLERESRGMAGGPQAREPPRGPPQT